jgi:hypothetical protein
VFPYDDDLPAAAVDALLVQLHESGLVRLYEAGGERLLEVRNFIKHQKVDHPAKSTFPPPPAEESGPTREPSPVAREDSRGLANDSTGLAPDKEGRGGDRKGRTSPAADAARGAGRPDSAVRELPAVRHEPNGAAPAATVARRNGPAAGEVPRARARPAPKYPHFPDADTEALHAAWIRVTGSPVEYGRLRKAFAGLYPAGGPMYPRGDLERAIEAAYEDAKEQAIGGKDFALRGFTPESFVQRIGYWVEWVNTPCVGEDGCLTDKGRRILSG